MTDIQLLAVTVGSQLIALLSLFHFLFRQMNVFVVRLASRIIESEARLTNRIQEVNDDTEILIHHVGVLQGRAGLTATETSPRHPGQQLPANFPTAIQRSAIATPRPGGPLA